MAAILMMEDDVVFAFHMSQTLSRAGYEVTWSLYAPDALDHL